MVCKNASQLRSRHRAAGKLPALEKTVSLALYLDWMTLKDQGVKQKDAIIKLGVSQSSLSRAIKKYQ
jgi:DNA-directed RNA polymerase specialized sigma subunit